MRPAIERTDDFRCHDPRLVQILPGREEEAAQVAIRLKALGRCDGIHVQGKDIVSWNFIEIVQSLDRFHFVNVDQSFKSVDLSLLRNATSLGITDIKVSLDVTGFKRLKHLGYHWLRHPVGMEKLDELFRVSFGGIGRAKDALPMRLPESIRELEVVRYEHDEIRTENPIALNRLSIWYARNLERLPAVPKIRSLEISFVGRDSFDYESIPPDVEELVIDSCAPIHSWKFLRRLTQLKHLYVDRTRCVPLDQQALVLVTALPSLFLPRSAGLEGVRPA